MSNRFASPPAPTARSPSAAAPAASAGRPVPGDDGGMLGQQDGRDQRGARAHEGQPTAVPVPADDSAVTPCCARSGYSRSSRPS